MSRGRTLWAAVGLLLASLAFALAVRPSLAASVGLESLLAVAGNGYFVAAGVAGFGLFYALFIGMSWWLAEPTQATPPTVETFAARPVPGSEFDDAIDELAGERGRAARPVEHRDLIRERLRRDAIETVRRVEDVPRAVAVDAVERGTWTRNRYATGFVGGDAAPTPRRHRVALDWLLRRDGFARRARHTVAALDGLEAAA